MKLVAVLCLFAVVAFGRNRELEQIDRQCSDLNVALTAATPFMFSGPDPWVELDPSDAQDMSDAEASLAVAYVYTVGPQIRRVFVRVTDQEDGWREDIVYYFNEHGALIKRVRDLDSPAANITLETVSYFRDGEAFKESNKHRSLGRGHRDSSKFIDPGAPTFASVDDLPFADLVDVWRGLS